MIDLCKLMWCAFAGLFRSRAALEAEILVLRHQLNVLHRKSPGRLAFSSIDRLVFAGIYALAPRSGRSEDRQTGNGDPLASCWLPGLLALEIATAGRATEYLSRNSRPYPRDEHCQPALGCASHSRRIAQARHRCRADYGCEVHGEDQAPTVPRVEDLPCSIMPTALPRWTCSSCRRSRFGCYTGF